MEQITYKRKKRGGKREMDFSNLPVGQIVHELPEAERVCLECGGPLHKCGQSVVRKELAYVPAQYKEEDYKKRGLSFYQRFQARLERAKPVAEAFFAWARREYEKNPVPKSIFGAALTYAVREGSWLMNVFLDGRLELSNNWAERFVRPFALGRKNRLFSNTTKGADASAAIYSMVETAKANGLKPFEYPSFLLETLPTGCSLALDAACPKLALNPVFKHFGFFCI